MVTTKTTTEEKAEEKVEKTAAKLKGKYICATGKRKTAAARLRLYKNGTGQFIVNGTDKPALTADLMTVAKQPLKLTGHLKDIDISVNVSGGGPKGQAEAIRHGVAQGLLAMDAELRPTLKAKGFLTRDARKKERKKPGLKKARKAPQWSKR